MFELFNLFLLKKMESERKFHLFQIHILIKRKSQQCLLILQNVQGIPNNIAYQFVYLEKVSFRATCGMLTDHPPTVV